MVRWLVTFLIAIQAIAAANEVMTSTGFLIRTWKSEDGLPGSIARSLGQTPDGYLWVATAEGVTRFDGIEFETIQATGEWQGRPIDFFRIFTPNDGSLWVSTYRHGLFRLVDDGLECVIADFFDGSAAELVTQVFTHAGVTYIVRGRRVWRLDGDEARVVTEPDPELSRVIVAESESQQSRGRSDGRQAPTKLVDPEGGIWRIEGRRLSFEPSGSDQDSATVQFFEDDLSVLDMFHDREGSLWLASPVHGLIQVRHRRVTQLQTTEGVYKSAVHTALQARNGDWWIANRNGFVDRIRNGIVSHHRLATRDQPRAVSCIFEDSSGRVWFGTRDTSVMQWDSGVEDFEGRFKDTPELSKVNAIAEDSSHALWFGGKRGLFRWDGSAVEKIDDGFLPEEAEISTLTFDSGETLYVGTTKGLVFSYDGSDFRMIADFEDHPRNWVSAIVPVGEDELWVATTGAGLFLRKEGQWRRFGSADSLPDERLTALVHDGEDSLWIGSLGGVFGVSREDLLLCLKEEDRLPHWMQLGRTDGLPTRECVGAVQPGVIRGSDGGFWFPTMAGLAGVVPEQVSATAPPPILQIRPVEVDGVPHALDDGPIMAGPGRARLGFQFAGISLTAPEKVTYQVQLVGLEESPQLIGTERRVSYPAVPPGRYEFEIVAINGDGIATPVPAMVPIEIRPHFWQTAWFVGTATALLLLVALSVGWMIARLRSRRRIRELQVRNMLEAERSRISRDLHDELGASLTELSILSSLAKEDPDDRSLRPSLDDLSTKAQQAVGELDEIVWATNPTQDSLSSLVEYLAFYAREFLKTVQVPFRPEIETNVPEVSIGPRRRHSVLLATREAINNAVKHAEPDSISLRVAIDGGRLVVRVRDDGKGFESEQVIGGDGLGNLRSRMTECGGECLITSVPGKGTDVTLILPLPS